MKPAIRQPITLQDAPGPLPDVLDEADRVATMAQARGLALRLLGGVAIHRHCQSARHPALARTYQDLDYAVPLSATAGVRALLEELGYQPRKTFNALYGNRRLYFDDPANGRHLDLFVDRFRMCHEIDWRARLALDGLTLPVADLLLTKLQIVQLTPKDVNDIVALLSDHALAAHDDDAINADYLVALAADDWGLWRTLTRSLATVGAHLPALASETRAEVGRKLEQLAALLARSPKTLRWKLRARLGERLPWYELPEEVQR